MKYKFYRREMVANIVDLFEDFLERKGVRVPNSERDKEDPDNTANIWGDDFDELMEGIINILSYSAIDVADTYSGGNDDWPTVFEIFEINGEKYIMYAGYGYYSPDFKNDSDPYRIVEYCSFEAPLKEVLEFERTTGESFEGSFSQDHKQYIGDCSLDGLIYIYDHWFDGKPPQPLPEQGFTEDIPCGYYFMGKEIYI